MSESSPALTIGAFAKTVGVNVETIRYYQRRGLLDEPSKPARGVRRYTHSDVSRVRFIKRAQWLGFTLDEIDTLLQLNSAADCHRARAIAEEKLLQIREKLLDMMHMERVLAGLVKRCDEPTAGNCCPLIEALES